MKLTLISMNDKHADYIVKISNIVATTDSGVSLNLIEIREKVNNTEYNPEIYFALIHHLNNPKISILVNWSGKLIFTGGKSISDLEQARDIFYNELTRIGFYPEKNVFYIQNLVITIDFGNYVKKDFFSTIKESVNLTKNSYRGTRAVYRNKNPKFTAIIFRSGKVSILGLKNFEKIDSSINVIKKVLNGEE